MAKSFVSWVESYLAKDEDVVQFEAAKSICELFEVFGAGVNVQNAF